MNITPHDLFAAAALSGLLAGRNQNAKSYDTQEVARIAVECADYMLLARAAPSKVLPAEAPKDVTAEPQVAPVRRPVAQVINIADRKGSAETPT